MFRGLAGKGAGGQGGTKGSAKVQIGAELLCKSAKVMLRGRDRGGGRKILSDVSRQGRAHYRVRPDA